MTEMHNILKEALKKGIPQSSAFTDQQRIPHILWVIPTEHVNHTSKTKELRKKFAKTLVEVAKLHNELICLPLKQVWCKENTEFYARDQHFTEKGAKALWMAMDRTLKYADSIVEKNNDRPLRDLFYQQKRALFSYHDYYQPTKRAYNNTHGNEGQQRRYGQQHQDDVTKKTEVWKRLQFD